MSNLVINRRRFLFVAPAIIAVSNLMPGHSIDHILNLPRQFWWANSADADMPAYGRLWDPILGERGRHTKLTPLEEKLLMQGKIVQHRETRMHILYNKVMERK